MHHTSLIATIVAGLGLAFVFGAIANRIPNQFDRVVHVHLEKLRGSLLSLTELG